MGRVLLAEYAAYKQQYLVFLVVISCSFLLNIHLISTWYIYHVYSVHLVYRVYLVLPVHRVHVVCVVHIKIILIPI